MNRIYVSTILCVAISCGAAAQTSSASPSSAEQITADMSPKQWIYQEELSQTLPVDDAWWHSLGDPVLDSLITVAFANNYDAIIAMHRIHMAQNSLSEARWGYAPNVSATAGWVKNRTSGATGAVTTPQISTDYFNAGLSASWEIDVFGRISEKVKAAKASANISKAEYAAVQVSLAANVASAYINMRMYQIELQVAREHIASQSKIVKITEARHEAGLASKLDVTEAKIVLYSTQASIPGLEASLQSTANTLATLLGAFPGEIPVNLGANQVLPQYQQLIALSAPAELLRRRPDIVQAEYKVAADAAALGIAKKEFLPTLSLNGSIGTAAHRLGDMFSKNSFTYTIQPTLTWPVFTGMSRRYAVLNAKEQVRMDVENYNLTVLQAAQEVSNSISSYLGALKQVDLYTSTLAQANEELKLSVDLYKNSLSPFSNVVTAQMNVLQYRISVVQSQCQALQSLIKLYQAMGGGWTTDSNNK